MKKPNILLLLPDQHRGDWLPYNEQYKQLFGAEQPSLHMPNLKQLMNSGLTFCNAITPSPLCAPARACLASGMRYEDCGVADNKEDYPVSKPTFYAALRNGGYQVGSVGKLDLHKATQFWGLDGWVDDLAAIGFTEAIDNAGKIDAVKSGAETPKDPYMAYLHQKGLADIHVRDMTNRGLSPHPTPLPDEAYCDNWIAQNAQNMLAAFSEEQPWFLQVNFTGPHEPFDVTKDMRKRWETEVYEDSPLADAENKLVYLGIKQNYAAMLENIDMRIGELLAQLKASGQLENTVVIYTSDHGEMLGTRNRVGKNLPYKPSVHIPLVFWGEPVRARGISHALTELQDTGATILDLAGLPQLDKTQALSLLPLLSGKATELRSYVRSALHRTKLNDGFCMVRTRQHVSIEWDQGTREKFDLTDASA